MTKPKPKHLHKPSGRPRLYDDPDKLQAKIDEYFQQLGDGKPLVTALALHCGMSIQRLFEYSKDPRFEDVIKAAKTRIGTRWEENVEDRNKATGAIFMMKSVLGFRDGREPNQPLQISGNKIIVLSGGLDALHGAGSEDNVIDAELEPDLIPEDTSTND